MGNVPVLDLTLLARLGFELNEGFHCRTAGDVEIRVDYKTGRGFLIATRTPLPVKFITVTQLKWFVEAFK